LDSNLRVCTACGIRVQSMLQYCQSCGAPAPSPTYQLHMPGEAAAIRPLPPQPEPSSVLPLLATALAALAIVVLTGVALLH